MSKAVTGTKHSEKSKKLISISLIGNKRGIGNKNKRKVTQDIILIINKLRSEGFGCRKIAKAVQLNKTTILNIFNKKYIYG
jgi:hypothetical protein